MATALVDLYGGEDFEPFDRIILTEGYRPREDEEFMCGRHRAYFLRKLIAKIDCAIRRLYEGEYGYCEVTGEPISLGRLEARPIATMTLEAQERHERIERISRDD